MVLAVTFVLCMRRFCRRPLQKMGFIVKHHEYLVHEDLPPFFDTLRQPAKNWVKKEQLHYNSMYGLNIYPQSVQEGIQASYGQDCALHETVEKIEQFYFDNG